LAVDCRSRGGAIEVAAVADAVGAGWQATAVAVNAANADVTLAAQAMEARMQDTAANLTTAAQQYMFTDNQSAADLRAVVTEV
jgi:hypothetical protein